MKFGIVRPKEQTVEIEEHADIYAAEKAAGLDIHGVDHGMVGRDLGVVVYEFGLFLPAAEQHYFSAGRRLYCGNAVLYAVGDEGETVDLERPALPAVGFFADLAAIERAIEAGQIYRPEMSVNGEVFWRWPNPPPADMREAMEKRGRR